MLFRSQCTYTRTVDLKKVANAIGFKNSFKFSINDIIEFEKILKTTGPVFVHIKVKPGNANVPIIDMAPEEIINRFMKEIKTI